MTVSSNDPAVVEAHCRNFFRSWVVGDERPDSNVGGVRRLPLTRTDFDDLPSRERIDELHGMPVTPGDPSVVVVEVLPLENVLVTRSGTTIRLEFLFCTDYPRERLRGLPAGAVRGVMSEHDPRLWLWTVQAIEVLRGELAGDADGLEFDVEVITAPFEAFAAEDLLPEG